MKRINIILLLLIFMVGSVHAQQRIRKLKEANDHYKSEQYQEAIELYELLMSTNAGRGVMGVDAKINMADCYRKTEQVSKADTLYKSILSFQEERPDILLGYGEALLATGKYDEARSYFLQYSEKRPDDPKGAQMVKRCDDIQKIFPLYDNVGLVFERLASDSMSDELAPAYYSTGIVFASDRVEKSNVAASWGEKERSFLDLYYSEMTPDGHLTTPMPFSRKLNAATRHDGPATFSRDGQHCYYSQSVKESPDAQKYALQIFASHIEEGDWNSPQVLEFVTVGHLFSHPCLSANGKELYFMSDIQGGYGGTDIWVSTYQNGKWAAPKNLGPDVNTDQNEGFPFIHPSGTLFFASKGHSGYGGFDLFRARPVGNGIDWTRAENLGEPFNSSFNDTYMLFSDDETSGFMVSSRGGGDNLYSFVVVGAEPKALPSGVVARGGHINFIDTSDVKIDDEALVDSLLNAGFTVVKNDPIPKNGNADKEPKDVTEDPNTNPNGKDPNVVNSDPTNPNEKDPIADKDPNIDKNWDKVNDPNDPRHKAGWDKDNNTTDKVGNDSNLPMLTTDPAKSPKLQVELVVMDDNSSQALKNAKVILRNLYNNTEETFTADQNGKVKFTLKADQKYLVRGEYEGYHASSLPITTTQAYEDQIVSGKLPLIKK